MTAEAQLPRGWRAVVQKMIDDSISKFQRSGFLRNASVNGGAGFAVGAGGKLTVRHPDGTVLAHLGAYDYNNTFDMPDGSRQPMALMYRADGSIALAMYDPIPGDGFQQFLALIDRSGNIIVSDDTDSGQGMARPYVPGAFYRVRFADMTASTTAAAFETLWEARLPKQQPKLVVGYRASMDTAATTGQVRVLVNGTQLGATTAEAFAVATRFVGPEAVAGAHMDNLTVEIQGQRTTATGALRIEPVYVRGQQS